jgi:large subunit ribosomal protein L20|uniref:Large ribosomal subunit protein bL20c n=1 Tax=Trifolium subterraneum TaxID=3900 RepID=B8R468_TRISU|nr:ribosomal protein L20 [Trifolium subterraneum]ACF20519.1 ribosomal protein L20 [Trifolium subterraneum]
MNRTKRGSVARKRRTKNDSFTSGCRGARSRIYRMSSQQKTKAFVSSDRDRDRKKRDFRSLWITRINAIIVQNKEKIYNIYSNIMHNLYKSRLLLNRKIVAQMAILKGDCLFMIANKIIKK